MSVASSVGDVSSCLSSCPVSPREPCGTATTADPAPCESRLKERLRELCDAGLAVPTALMAVCPPVCPEPAGHADPLSPRETTPPAPESIVERLSGKVQELQSQIFCRRAPQPGFVPADSYDGPRPGYVFKSDVCGLGYYRAGYGTTVQEPDLEVETTNDGWLDVLPPQGSAEREFQRCNPHYPWCLRVPAGLEGTVSVLDGTMPRRKHAVALQVMGLQHGPAFMTRGWFSSLYGDICDSPRQPLYNPVDPRPGTCPPTLSPFPAQALGFLGCAPVSLPLHLELDYEMVHVDTPRVDRVAALSPSSTSHGDASEASDGSNGVCHNVSGRSRVRLALTLETVLRRMFCPF
uniref:Uncharacterized protein n=1 Tax=Eutreptiella gymnastica TaxID=73025 RepID=A0A7S1J8Q0_9EUGL